MTTRFFGRNIHLRSSRPEISAVGYYAASNNRLDSKKKELEKKQLYGLRNKVESIQHVYKSNLLFRACTLFLPLFECHICIE